MKFHGIDQMDLVSPLGEREGVGSRPAAYVKNDSRCRAQIPGQN